MNQPHHHHHHLQNPPPELPHPQIAAVPPINHQSTTQIFRKTTSIILSYPVTFLFIFSLVFTFRFNVEYVSNYLISYVDKDPSLKSLISRLDLYGHHHYNQYPPQQLHPRRRRAFLQLSRVGTLDDDFFSGDADYDRSLFHPTTNTQPNATFVIMNSNLGVLGDHIADNGILYPQVIRSRSFVFKPPPVSFESSEEKPLLHEKNETEEDLNAVVDLQFLIRGFELGHFHISSLLYFLVMFSAGYGYFILAFLVTYTWAHGIVFDLILNDLLGRHKTTIRAVWDGTNLGLRRVSGIVLMRWALRDTLSQLMGIFFFGSIDDPYIFFKFLVRMKLMPFSDIVLWVAGYENESLGMWILWCLVDVVASFLFSMLMWVALVDTRRNGRELVQEACHLLEALLLLSLEIKCLELLTCGGMMRLLFSKTVGLVFFLAFRSFMEVYFMVTWLLFYLAARHEDAISSGRVFGRREMEVILEGMR